MKLVVANDVIKDVKWAHTLTDNTFNKEQCKLIDEYFKALSIKTVQEEIKTKAATQWTGHIFCLDSSRWAGVIDDLFERNKDLKLLYGSQRDFFIVYELVATAPGFIYKWHRDVSRKAVSGVVYWGKEGEGTIMRTANGESQVKWEHNRALWFGNTRDDLAVNDPLSPWHRFENNSSELRFTVNINFTPQNEMAKYVKERKNQFLHFWNHNEPLWSRMGNDLYG